MRVVDLTHHLENGMPLYPGIPEPSFDDIAAVERDGYAMSEYRLRNHIGTHVDAPAHHAPGGDTLDEIPLASLVTEAVTVDLSRREPGPIGREELEPLLGDLHAGDWLFLCSDNGRNWGGDAYWTGWSYPDAEASQRLIERGIVGIGFDGPSADPVDTETFELHQVWLGGGRMILENLTNLELLPARTQVVVAPLKVRRANGAPARVLAFVPDHH
ncbi:MAG TPA: cyclase family protein [Gaiellaceae bacterium]|nr:cyclase family protein [Gaiellaceae bacterium]